MELKSKHPGWTIRRVAAEVGRALGVSVPYSTVYFWLKRGSKPNVAPIRLLPELGYAVGALMTDCARSSFVRLRVRDRDFAEEFAKALAEVTSRRYDVEEEGCLYIVGLKGSALRYIVRSGLWRAVGLAWPREFLRGLFDGDGGVGVGVEKRPAQLKVAVTLDNSSRSLLELAKRLLEELGVECAGPWKKDRRGDVVRICGRECVLKKDCWRLAIQRRESVERFAALINFRVGRKRSVLEDAIRISREHESSRERVEAWLRLYEKRNGKWVSRAPGPPPPGSGASSEPPACWTFLMKELEFMPQF